ncbi:MAG: septum formation family protein [Actinomyces sp.]|uniref:septum formation family protein n=1 Tax=Actinomyces sp. TaxID=29317 RepID=UPI0026DCBD69|nr:septum formation family protein [Actinomyces sp.]MDO4244231.1 septum formation family protein [Actinomyces sp.]
MIITGLSAPMDTSDPRIPQVLRPLLNRALHPDPAQRFRDGSELAAALSRLGDVPRPPSATPTPAQVDAQGIPYSDDMPWPPGTCLRRETLVLGGTSLSEVDCAQADWIVFAGGTFDPASTASSPTEALADDPQVNATCTSTYAELYGLDLSTSYSINTLGPNDEEWAAGERGFVCVLGRL